MSQVTLSVKIDEKVKKDFSILCDELGLNMTTAINIFMKTVIREQKIPFEIGLKPNKETIEAITDVNSGKNLSKTFNSISELMEDLNA